MAQKKVDNIEEVWTGNWSTQRVHRLVAIAFIPNTENKPFINHINGIKTDNRVENLEWCTNTENIRHGFRTGLYKPRKGVDHPRAKLSTDDIIKIRSMYPGQTYTKIASEFSIVFSAAYNIVNRKRWNHIP